ncbi:MAG: cadherin domain-containing protein, partial [Chloroflexota bacterium]|nr:cadherin domain-containing protein [Chloroflexota bacterium]
MLLGLLLTGAPGAGADATCSAPPVNLTSALSEDGSAVVLTWEASPDCTPDEYAVYRRDMDVSGSRMTKIDSVDGSVLTYTDSTVTAGQDYRYRIRSNDQGPRSGRTDITIPEAAVSEPEPTPEPASEQANEPRVEPRADVTLISNFGNAGISNQSVTGLAQRFTTGASMAGYRLSAVEVYFVSGGQFALSVCTVETDNTPTSDCDSFTAPSSFTANSTLSFTAPSNTDLMANTSYTVVVRASASFTMQVTSSNAEDPGGASGWSIADGSHQFLNSDWSSQSNKVRIKVRGAVLNSEPAFDEDPPHARMVNEDVAGGTAVGAPVTATDDDGDTLHYHLNSATLRETFTVDSATGQIRVKSGVTLNHEVASSYMLPIRVRDGFDADRDPDTVYDDTITVTVTVVDLDEPATVSFTPSSGPYEAGDQITATVADEDDSFSVDTYQWSRGATQTGSFADIDGATSATYTMAEADLNNFLRVTVQYDDTHGNDKTISATTGTKVVLGNAEPEFSAASTTRNVDENTASNMNVGAPVSTTDNDGDTLEYRLTGTDAGSFSIESGSGQIKTSASLNFESKSSYSVVVEVRDKKDSTGASDTAWDDTIAVTINLNNLDEPGTVTISGTESGGEELTASLSDIDGTVSNVTWQWALGASASGPFAPVSGATANKYTSVAVDVNRFLRATATYTDPQGSGKSASAVTGQISASNAEPEFDETSPATREVPENSGGGVNVGDPVEAMDDDNDTLTYSLSGTDASSFTIDAGTGQIKTKNGITYNFESRFFYSVTVHVRDSKDAAGNPNTSNDDDITVNISLTDVNEQPAITTTQTAISVAENQTSVLTYAANDPDNSNNEAHDSSNTLTWSVESADDGGFFEIGSTTGVLTFQNAPNFEDKQDAGGDNVYNVTVTVTDNGIDGARGASNRLSISKQLAVTVTDVNETPTLTTAPATATFDENATGVVATYIATDPDMTTGTMSWDLSGNDAGDFNITSTVNGTAELTFKNPPDYEDPQDTGTNNTYDVIVRVRDNGSPRLEDSQSVQVMVNDLNETPVVSGDMAPSFQEIDFSRVPGDIPASDYVVATFTAYDDDDDTVSWSVAGDDAAHFSINASTGVLSFDIAPVTHPVTGELTARPDLERPDDMDGNNEYVIQVRADDQQGESNSVGTFEVTVTVTALNEIPVLISGDLNPTYAEIPYDATSWDSLIGEYRGHDEEGQSIFYETLAGPDTGDIEASSVTTIGGDRFGRLRFKNRPNFEDPADSPESGQTEGDNVYKVTMRLRDT